MVVVPKLDLTKKVMSSYSIFYVLGEARKPTDQLQRVVECRRRHYRGLRRSPRVWWCRGDLPVPSVRVAFRARHPRGLLQLAGPLSSHRRLLLREDRRRRVSAAQCFKPPTAGR